jgi:ADP-heptose:LPS heptosyltransferase
LLSGFDEIVSWYGSAREDFRSAVAHLPFRFHPALPPPPGIPRIAVPEVPRTRVIVHPGSGSPRKNWPLARFQELARRLQAEWAVREDGSPVIEDLYQLACWLKSATVYIGNDSGITHLASAVGAPVVALFGPTDPAVWRPRGEQVEVVKRDSMEEIDVDSVVGAVERLLSGLGGGQGDRAGGGSQSVRVD